MRRGGDERGGGDEAVGDVVHHDSEAFEGPHAEQVQIARLREDDFVGGFVPLLPRGRGFRACQTPRPATLSETPVEIRMEAETSRCIQN